jgi:hypothetical protein
MVCVEALMDVCQIKTCEYLNIALELGEKK